MNEVMRNRQLVRLAVCLVGMAAIDFFRRFMQDSRFNDMPVILETPDDTIWRDEIKMLRSFEL